MGSRNRAADLPGTIENAAGYIALSALAIFPILEIAVRIFFGATIPGIAELVSHLTILVTLAGCLLTTRESKHLAMSAGIDRIRAPWKTYLTAITAFFSLFVVTTLFWTSASFLEIYISDLGSGLHKIAFIPKLYFLVFLPVSFLVIAGGFLRRASGGVQGLWAGIGGILFGTFLSLPAVLFFLSELAADAHPDLYLALDNLLYKIQGFQVDMMATLKMPLILLLVVSAFFGTPIFVVLGGVAFFLYAANAEPLTSVVDESYKILTSVGIPALPLFTLTGFLLSRSKAGERFLRLFKALLGWLPGGYGVAAILILAFFTTFTGASGVTIMALGGLLSYILIENRYGDRFSLGLITASGSIGLLFPPSMPLILFGIIAQFILKDWVLANPAAAGLMQTLKIGNLFLAGVLPGLLMVFAMGAMVVIHALRSGAPRHPFNWREAGAPLVDAIWEILLPVFVVVLFLSGFITITEVAAISALYILMVEMFIHRDVKIKDLPGIGRQTLVIVG
jgi:TRAP-type C4-dicarboxylate transport system permease small subunit